MLKKIMLNTLIYGISPHISKIASIIAMPFITPFLTERDYGIYGLILSYTGLFGAFSILGMTIILSNTLIKHPKIYIPKWRVIYGFLTLWMIVYAFIQGVLLYFLLPSEVMESNNSFLLIFLAVGSVSFFGASSTLGVLYYQINEKGFQVGIRTVIIGIIGVFITYYTIAVLKLGYLGWFYAIFISSLLNNISYFIPLAFIHKLRPAFNFKYIKDYLKISLPTLPHYYSSFLLDSSNRLIMDKMGISINVIGRFNISAQFASYGGMLGYAMNTAFNPQIMRYIRSGDEDKSKKLVLIMQAIMFAFTVFCGIWMNEIIAYLVRIETENFSQIYQMAIVLLFAYNYRPMYIASGNMFFYHEKTNRLIFISFLAGILNVILNIIFLNFYGIWASVIIYFLATTYMGYSGFFMKEYKDNTKVKYPIALIFSINLVLMFLVLFLVDLSFNTKMILTLSGFFIVGILFLVYKRKILTFIKN